MTDADFELFLRGSMILCGVMALISLLRIRSKGLSAVFLGGAFVAMIGLLWALASGHQGWTIAAGLVVGVFLVADGLSRAAKPRGSE